MCEAWKTISSIIGRFGGGLPRPQQSTTTAKRCQYSKLIAPYRFTNFIIAIYTSTRRVEWSLILTLWAASGRRELTFFEMGIIASGYLLPIGLHCFADGAAIQNLTRTRRVRIVSAYPFACVHLHACVCVCVCESTCILYDLTHMHPIISVESLHNEIYARATDSTIGTSFPLSRHGTGVGFDPAGQRKELNWNTYWIR